MVLTSKWGRILQEMQCLWQICLMFVQSADKLAEMRTKFHVIQVKLIMPVWCFTVQCDPSVSSLSVVAGRCGIVDRDWADLMGRAPPDTLNKNGKCYCLWQSQCHTGHWECKLWKLIFTLIFYLRPPGPPSKGFFPFPLLYFIGYKSQNRLLKVKWWDIPSCASSSVWVSPARRRTAPWSSAPGHLDPECGSGTYPYYPFWHGRSSSSPVSFYTCSSFTSY